MNFQHPPPRSLLGKLWFGTLGYFFLFLERLRGASTLAEVFSPARVQAKTIATSVLGYRLSVYCQRRHYTRVYDRFFVPTRHHVIYQITGVASNDAPEALKQACGDLMVNISTDIHWSVDEDFQEELVVQSYLDLLIAHLKRHQPRLQTA